MMGDRWNKRKVGGRTYGMMTGRGVFLGTGSQIPAPARLPGSGKASRASSSPWWWGAGTEKGPAAHVAYGLGGARVGSRRTEAQEPLWVFPASCPVLRGPRPLSRWKGHISGVWIPIYQSLHQLLRTGKSVYPSPPGLGAHGLGSSSPFAAPHEKIPRRLLPSCF